MIIGAVMVLLGPTVQGYDRGFELEVGKLVLLDDGKANCINVMHSGDANVEKGWQLGVFSIANCKEKYAEFFIYGDRWV